MRYTNLVLASAAILSTVTQAADAVDATVREYILSRATSTGDEWYKDDLSDLNARQKEVGKRPKTSETSDIKKQIAVEKAKLYFLREMRSSAVKKVDAEKMKEAVKASLDQAKTIKEIQDKRESTSKAIKDNGADLVKYKVELTEAAAKLEAAKDKFIAANPTFEGSREDITNETFAAAVKKEVEEQNRLSEKVASTEKSGKIFVEDQKKLADQEKSLSSGVNLGNGVIVKTQVEPIDKDKPDGKKKVTVNLSLDKEAIENGTKKLPKEVKDNMTTEEMAEFFDDKVGSDVFSRTFDGKKTPDDIAKDMASDSVRNDIAKSVDGKVTDARSDIGSKDDPNSTIGKLQEDLNEKSGIGKEDELRDLDAKKKIASFIKANPSMKDLEACDLMMKAVGWSALSTVARGECSDKDPAKSLKDKSVADKMNLDNKKVQAESQAARAKELAELQQHCEALYRQRAMQEATSQVTAPINALMDKLVLQYNNSELYASLCAPQTGEGVDEFDRNIGLDPRAEATRMTQRMLGDPEKLQRERDAISLVMRRAIYSLEKSGNMMGGALNANAQTGMLDMGQMKGADEKVQRMGAIYNCSKGVLDAIDAGIEQRRQEVNGQLTGASNGVGGTMLNGNAAGTVNVNSATGTTNNRRVINNGQRPATQRTNQLLRNGAGAGSRNGAPAPNYMGN